jgi:hypothetical protein
MTGILADLNVEGQVAILLQRWQGPFWREVWVALNLRVETFETLSLALNATDAAIWRACQDRQIVLITGNRNSQGPESLEAVIRQHNTPASLPVFTLANPDRVAKSKGYAERVAERLLEYLLEIDQVRGTGRLYVP